MIPRAHKRVHVEKEMECLINGERQLVLLYNLSTGGCMFETSAGGPEIGDEIVINLAGIDNAPGEVVWAYGRSAGVQFDRNIHDALVEHLGFAPSAHAFEEFEPRDKFGRLLPCIDQGRTDPDHVR